MSVSTLVNQPGTGALGAPGSMTDVLLIEDHPIVTLGIEELFGQAGLTVVGKAADANAALDVARAVEWDVAVVDLKLPGAVGTSVVRDLRAAWPDRGLVVYSAAQPLTVGVEAVFAGAKGFVAKSDSYHELVAAVRAVAEGRTHLPDAITDVLVRRAQGEGAPHTSLTARQREVLQLMLQGDSLTEIAARLGISDKTVSTHKRRIFDHLGIENQVELVLYGVQHGLIPGPSDSDAC